MTQNSAGSAAVFPTPLNKHHRGDLSSQEMRRAVTHLISHTTKALRNIAKKWSDGREEQKDRECPWLMQARAHRSGPIGSPGLNITSVSVGPTYITAMQLRPRLWKLLQVYFYPSQIKEIPSDLTSITPDESHHFSHASTQFDNDMRPTFVPPRSSSWYINGK